MKKSCYLLLVLAATELFLTGCGDKNKEVLAKIDDRVINLGEFNKRIEMLPKHIREIMETKKGRFLDEIVKEELLYREALESRLDRDPETQEVIAEAKKKILISRLIKNRVDDKISIPEEEIKKYYDEHSEDFMLPERWRASHILVDTVEEAEEIKERLQQGASFEDLARNMSKDVSAKQGGDIGYFSKGQLIPDFEEVCFKLGIGELSGVVKTQFGYHIIKLTDKKSPEVQEFSQVKELIRKELQRERKLRLLDELINGLRNSAKITINEKLLGEMSRDEAKDAEKAE